MFCDGAQQHAAVDADPQQPPWLQASARLMHEYAQGVMSECGIVKGR